MSAREGDGTGERQDASASTSNANASNRDARTSRPRVQQLRPTNKDTIAPGQQQQVPLPSSATATEQSQQRQQQTPQQGTSGGPRVVPRIVTGQGSGSTIIVNSLQKGNPVLKHISNIGWEYGDIVPDYQVGVAAGALFLSLRYHQLHPEYIHQRIKKLGNMYTLRLLLLHCDTDQPDRHIKELTKVALVNNLTIMVAWSSEEVAAYLERYKMFEHKPPDLIRERVNDDYISHLTSALTSIRGVNKADVMVLMTQFGSLSNIATATADELAQCPGFGEIKVRRVREAFAQPFRAGETRTGRERRAQRERMYDADAALVDADRRARETSTFSRDAMPRLPFGRPVLADHGEGGSGDDSESGAAVAIAATDTSAIATANGDVQSDMDDEIQDADDFDSILDNLTEEEKLQLAMEMSISGGGDMNTA